ncbi:MAG: hypothetical protein H5T94_01630 [Pseudothermotoga sp.]|nr:hypothetical protein [Pseudothermotoga sp.]
MKLLFETTVAIGLSVLFLILIKKRKIQLKNLENVVLERLRRNGWTVHMSLVQNGAKFVLLKRGRNSILVVFLRHFGFDKFKRAVILALLNEAQRVEVYYSSITPHTKKAVYFFNKNARVHRMKMTALWRGTS